MYLDVVVIAFADSESPSLSAAAVAAAVVLAGGDGRRGGGGDSVRVGVEA